MIKIMSKLKVVFMGTPSFAIPTLQYLYNDNDIELSLVVTKKDQRSDRGKKIKYSDIKNEAINYNIDILTPEKISNDYETIERIKKIEPDFIIVVAYGQILSKEIIDIPKKAIINGHASLLPKYRGASPMQASLLNGDLVTGITTMFIEEKLDAGDILEQKEINIDKKETIETLSEKLSIETAELIIHTIKSFDNIKRKKQNENEVSFCKIIKKEDGEIDFNDDKETIERKIRAYHSWPTSYINIDECIFKILDVDFVDDLETININKSIESNELSKLTNNIFYNNKNMYMRCKNGLLKINIIKPSGKKEMTTRDYINGLNNK